MASPETTTNLPPGRWASRAGGVSITTAVATAIPAVGWRAAIAAIARASIATSVGRRTTHTTAHAAHVTSGIGATATASTTAATTITASLTGNVLQEGRDLLVRLLQEVNQVAHDTAVSTVEESGGHTGIAGTTGTTDTVDIVIDVGGQIVVDDVSDVGDIETTGRDSSRNQDGAAAVPEVLESTLTLALGAVTVDGRGGEVLVDEEITQRVRHTLGLDEDEGETSSSMGVKDVEQDRTLVMVLDVLDLLGDVLRGGANTTHGKEHVVLQEITSQHLDVARERGREHQRLAVVHTRHILALDNTTDLGLETHVQHAVSLVKHQVLDVDERDTTTLDKVNQTTRSCDQQVTAALNLAELRTNVGTTVHDARTDPRAVGELASLVVDLGNELTGRSEDQGRRISLALTAIAELIAGLRRERRRSVFESLGENREQETASLSGTRLSTRHQVATIHHDRNGVLLDRSGSLVVGELDVRQQMVIQGRVGKRVHGFGNVVAGRLDRDIVVVGEVDTSGLLRRVVGAAEELTLQSGIGRARDVLAVAPLSVSGSSGIASAMRTSMVSMTWVSVSIWIEGATWTFKGTPAGVTIHTGWVIIRTPPVAAASISHMSVTVHSSSE